MKLISLKNSQEIDALAGGEFLQSWFWGEMTQRGGEIVERWGAEEAGKILAAITIIKKSFLGSYFYWYAPRGPRGAKLATEFLITELKNIKAGAVFLRIEPEEIFNGVSARKSVALQPQKTLWLDLTKSEAELLSDLHQKTRYNIRLAEKKGVEIIEAKFKTETAVERAHNFTEFWRLMTLTGERDAFRLHDAKHYQNLISAADNIKLFFARQNEKNIATGLFCFFGDRVTYLHGASDNEARNLMAPYRLQWEIIKRAKEAGYKYYDFYGIDAKKWPGVTRFKIGFGGFSKEYAGTYDVVFRPVIYGFYEFLRKIKRRFR